MEDYAEHICFYACIKVFRARRRDAPVELDDAVDRTLRRPQAPYHVDPQTIEVALTVLGFSEFHARGHMQQVADGVLPYSVSLKPGTYVSAASSTDLIAPSPIAIPISIAVIDFAIDCEMSRSRSVRPYW